MQKNGRPKYPLRQRESCCNLEPGAFTWLKSNSYKENLKGLDSVRFRNPSSDHHVHLDVGCGPGNFLQEHLLPRLRPCRRVVAVDNSPYMLEYATRHCLEPEVTFDFMDIEQSDPQRILDTHDSFDRVFSFLTFHYVWDLPKAYRNVYNLLKDEGECLILYFTRTAITDVFQRLHEMEEWSAYTPFPAARTHGKELQGCAEGWPWLRGTGKDTVVMAEEGLRASTESKFDLKSMFAERYCFNAAVPEEEIIANEIKVVTTAGLELVSCRAYASHWTFPTVADCLDPYIPFFKMTSVMPQEKHNAFREAAKQLVLQASTENSDEISLKYDVIVAHAQKPKRSL
ncbi:uncharacterized protein LOC144148019 [Haemaphysalis longicornis]